MIAAIELSIVSFKLERARTDNANDIKHERRHGTSFDRRRVSKRCLKSWASLAVPGVEARDGDNAAHRYLQFFVAEIRNKHTRTAYFRACRCFFSWCDEHELALRDVEPVHVATYIETLAQDPAARAQQR